MKSKMFDMKKNDSAVTKMKPKKNELKMTAIMQKSTAADISRNASCSKEDVSSRNCLQLDPWYGFRRVASLVNE